MQTDFFAQRPSVTPTIYAYSLPDVRSHKGYIKIGYTERFDVRKRIHEQTHTAAMQLRPDINWYAPAFFNHNREDFKDKEFHQFLVKSGVENRNL